ncbi:MAG TPA: DUF655 domain-containing protein [Euryarchaeota archaeon]|nr:MAG: DUF655 domain-containing protein [Thermococci archaeon]RLF97287.1 MAG: DUF655 domain-containing protein [Thermococci archaeon]HDI10125.1 DUF655 domain-containing protein [Euryarchaeota archaeon]
MYRKRPSGQERRYEEYVRVLDYLPEGHLDENTPFYRREPIIQVIGEKYFTLLELSPKSGARVLPHDRLYIGRDRERREKVDKVKRRISYEELSSNAKFELPYVLEEIVSENEDKFLRFFNEAGPITTRFHQLELLPGIGKKKMWKIIEERKKGPFKSFDDLSSRVPNLSDPKKMIAERIVMELQGKDKYRIFVRTMGRDERY